MLQRAGRELHHQVGAAGERPPGAGLLGEHRQRRVERRRVAQRVRGQERAHEASWATGQVPECFAAGGAAGAQRLPHRFEDLHVAGAAAQVARQPGADLVVGRRRMALLAKR